MEQDLAFGNLIPNCWRGTLTKNTPVHFQEAFIPGSNCPELDPLWGVAGFFVDSNPLHKHDVSGVI